MTRATCRVHSLLFAGLVVALAPASGAAGKRKRPGSKRGTIAIFPLVPNPDVPEDIRREFDGLMHGKAQAAGLTVLGGVALDHRLRESAAGAIGVCRGNAACVAKLGKKVRADEVVYASASTAGDTVTIAVFVVSPARARLERKASLQAAIKEEVEEGVAQLFPTIFKIAAPGGTPAADPLAAMGDLDLEPLAAVEPLPQPTTIAEPDIGLDPEPEPDPTPVAGGELVDPLEDDPDLGLDFEPESPMVTLTAPPIPEPPTPWLRYGAYVLGGLGLVTAGAGGGFGLQSMVLHNRAVPDNVPQRLAADRQERSLAAADRANLMYILGGTLAVVGGVMFTLDLALFDRSGD